MSSGIFRQIADLQGPSLDDKAVLLALAFALQAQPNPTLGDVARGAAMSAVEVGEALDRLKEGGQLAAVLGPEWRAGA